MRSSPRMSVPNVKATVLLMWSSHPGHSFKFFLGNGGRQSIVELMRPLPVVPVHQIMADIPMCLLSAGITETRNPFSFEAAKQPHHRRNVPAIAASAHALLHAITPMLLTEGAAEILDALIRMKQDTRWAASLFVGEVERFGDQSRIRLG